MEGSKGVGVENCLDHTLKSFANALTGIFFSNMSLTLALW